MRFRGPGRHRREYIDDLRRQLDALRRENERLRRETAARQTGRSDALIDLTDGEPPPVESLPPTGHEVRAGLLHAVTELAGTCERLRHTLDAAAPTIHLGPRPLSEPDGRGH